MEFKQLIEDDDAVSPVIGVILMVAITVILAAVIGTFVLGLGDQVQTTAPNAQFNFDYESANAGNLTITHSGGDGIQADEVYLTGDVDNSSASDLSWASTAGLTETIRAGESVLVADSGYSSEYNWSNGGAGSTGAEVSVVWQDSDSDQSSTLRTWSED